MADGDAGGNGGAGNAKGEFRNNPRTGKREHRHKGVAYADGTLRWHPIEQNHGSDAHTQFVHQSAGLGRNGMGGDSATAASNMAAGAKPAPMKNKNTDIGDIKSPLDVFSEKHNIPAEKIDGWKKFMSAGGKLALGTAANVLPGLASKGMSAIRRLTQSLFSADPMSAPSAILGESSMLAMSTAQDISDGIDRTYNILPEADKDAISGTIRGRKYLREKEEADRASSDVMDWMDGKLGKDVDINDLDTDSLDVFSRELEKMTDDTLNGIAAKQMNGEPITEADRTKLGMYQAMLSNISERGKGLEREHKANAADIRTQETHDRRMERQQSAAELQQKYNNSTGTERIIRDLLGDGGKRDVKIEQDGLVGRSKLTDLHKKVLDSADSIKFRLDNGKYKPGEKKELRDSLKEHQTLLGNIEAKEKAIDKRTTEYKDDTRTAAERNASLYGKTNEITASGGSSLTTSMNTREWKRTLEMLDRRTEKQAPDYWNATVNRGLTDKEIDGYSDAEDGTPEKQIWDQREALRKDPLYVADTNLIHNLTADRSYLDAVGRVNSAINNGKIPPEKAEEARKAVANLQSVLRANYRTTARSSEAYTGSDESNPLYGKINDLNTAYGLTNSTKQNNNKGTATKITPAIENKAGTDTRSQDQKISDTVDALGGNADRNNDGNNAIAEAYIGAGILFDSSRRAEDQMTQKKRLDLDTYLNKQGMDILDTLKNGGQLTPRQVAIANLIIKNGLEAAIGIVGQRTQTGSTAYTRDHAADLEKKAMNINLLNVNDNTKIYDQKLLESIVSGGINTLLKDGKKKEEEKIISIKPTLDRKGDENVIVQTGGRNIKPDIKQKVEDPLNVDTHQMGAIRQHVGSPGSTARAEEVGEMTDTLPEPGDDLNVNASDKEADSKNVWKDATDKVMSPGKRMDLAKKNGGYGKNAKEWYKKNVDESTGLPKVGEGGVDPIDAFKRSYYSPKSSKDVANFIVNAFPDDFMENGNVSDKEINEMIQSLLDMSRESMRTIVSDARNDDPFVKGEDTSQSLYKNLPFNSMDGNIREMSEEAANLYVNVRMLKIKFASGYSYKAPKSKEVSNSEQNDTGSEATDESGSGEEEISDAKEKPIADDTEKVVDTDNSKKERRTAPPRKPFGVGKNRKKLPNAEEVREKTPVDPEPNEPPETEKIVVKEALEPEENAGKPSEKEIRYSYIRAGETPAVKKKWDDAAKKILDVNQLGRRSNMSIRMTDGINEMSRTELIRRLPDIDTELTKEEAIFADPNKIKRYHFDEDGSPYTDELARSNLENRLMLSRLIAIKGSGFLTTDRGLKDIMDKYSLKNLKDMRNRAESYSVRGFKHHIEKTKQ